MPHMLFASLPSALWIRIDGKGSYQISVQLRDFVMRKILAGEKTFVIDLDRCTGMDSTFMGTLLGISSDISISPGTSLDLVNVNGRNVQLLQNLGLTSILAVDERNERWSTERQDISQHLTPCDTAAPDKTATAEVMLEAHQALAKAQPENVARFQDVIHFLKEDLRAHGSSTH